MNNDPIPDFILNNQNDYSNGINTFGGGSYNDPIPDFIKNQEENIVIPQKRNLNDEGVKTQLGINFDDSFSSDSKQVKEYVDSLSDEDYEIRDKLREEGYSLDARKVLMDNREDLYDITAPGNKKFWSGNKNSFMQYLLDDRQDTVDFQEDVIHPRSQRIEDWLDVQSADLMNYSYDEIKQEMYNNAVDPNDNNLVKWMRRQAVKPLASVKRGAAIAGGLLFDIASKGVNLLDNLGNISTQLGAGALNSIADERKGYDLVINDPLKESTIWGSYVEGVADTMGIAFTRKFPIATWILTTVGSESDFIGGLMEAANNGIKGVWKRVDKVTGIDKYNLKYLTPEEQEEFYNNQATATWILFSAAAGEGLNRLSKTETYQRLQQAIDYAKKTSKVGLQEGIKEVKETKQMMEQQPEGTEFRTKGGTKFAEVTPEGVQTTTYGNLRILQKLFGRQVNGWIRGFEWFYKNKNKLVTRDPNAPVGELPDVQVPEVKIEDGVETPTEEIKPIEEIKEEVKTPETGVKTTPKSVAKKGESTKNQTIGEYIKKISNEITGKKGGMGKDLFEKFSSSPDLQNEYINTIDPYIRANGGENPSGVIENQLNDFIETAKEQLQERRNNNIDERKGQMKYKVQIPESDIVKWEQEDIEIKDLIKTLSKQSDNPEKFLNYLLKLPESKTQALNKFIPNFSRNLELIKDTLAITKAITSEDLLGKFLKFKSTWGTRNKNFIRKYLYKKLKEAYTKAGVKRNMYEIEDMLNKMSEEQLVELEEEIVNDNIPAYMKEDFLNNLYDKLDKGPIEAVEGKKIGETTIQLPKKTREDIIDQELTKQGYRRENDTTPVYKTEEELRQHQLPDGTTIGDWMDRVKAHLSPKAFNDFRLSEADFWNKAINYNQKGLDISSFVAGHEIAHFVLGKLTTSELFDLTERIRKLTKDSGKEVNRVGMGEYLADTISNYWNRGNIDGLKNLLTENLKGAKKEITEHIQNLLENFKKDKLFQDREPRYENPRHQGGITAGERMDFLRKVDPNFKDYSFDLDANSPTFSEMRFNMKDGKSLSWEEWKETLSHDQYLKLYSSEDLFNLEKEIKNQSKSNSWKDDIKKEIDEAEAYFGESKYEKYQKAVKNIDSDIIGLIEKDGKIYVKYIIESQRERYELSDRPGYIEVKESPAKDYFTEEELNQLPKDLVAKIKKNAD